MSVCHRKWNVAVEGTLKTEIKESNRQTARYRVLAKNIIGQNETVMDRAGTRHELWTTTCGKRVHKDWQCQSKCDYFPSVLCRLPRHIQRYLSYKRRSVGRLLSFEVWRSELCILKKGAIQSSETLVISTRLHDVTSDRTVLSCSFVVYSTTLSVFRLHIAEFYDSVDHTVVLRKQTDQ